VCSERDAAGRRQKTGPRHVDEHGAAAPGDARPSVVIDFDNQVIKMIGAAQPVPACSGFETDGSIVATVSGRLAPCITRSDAAQWQQRMRRRMTVGPPPQPNQPEAPARCPAIPFALVRSDPPTPERHRNT